MRIRRYCEGSVFLVPLRTGGFAPGVLTRSGAEAILFGYFFHLRLDAATPADRPLDPEQASHRLLFSDLGLFRGTWPVVGAVTEWDRARWPMPEFGRRLPGASVGRRVRMSEDEPNRELSETPATSAELARLPSAGLYGAGAVEILLTRDHDPGYRSRDAPSRPGRPGT
jgi:hypothetical protein